MSVPFKYKQLYRDLFDYLSNSKPSLAAGDFDLFVRMLDPPPPTALATAAAEKAPMPQDPFLTFIAETQKATGENYETMLWRYVGRAVQYNLFSGAEALGIKEARLMVDASLKMYKKEAELSVLYRGACPAAAAAGEPAEWGSVQITASEMAAFLRELSKSVALFDVLKLLLPKKRGGKTTSVEPPALGGLGSATPSPSAGEASPTPPPAPPAAATQAPEPAPAPAAAVAPPAVVVQSPVAPAAEPIAPTVAPTAEASAPLSAASVRSATPPPPPKEDPPPPPPSSPPPATPLKPIASAELSAPPPPPPVEEVPAPSAVVNTAPFAAAANISVASDGPGAPPHGASVTRKPSAAALLPLGAAGGGDASSSFADADTVRSPTWEQQQQQSFSGQQQRVPFPQNPNQQNMQQSQQQQQAASSALSSGLQRLANEQQAALSLFPHHDPAVGGGVLPLPRLPSEVAAYVTELDRQRELLLERLEAETAQLSEASAAAAVLKDRIKRLSEANAAYFAAGGVGPSSLLAPNEWGGGGGAGLTTTSASDAALMADTAAEAALLDPEAAAASSPFFQLRMNRERLRQRMAEWLAHAQQHNAFLREEVRLAREGCRYDKASAALAAQRDREAQDWAAARAAEEDVEAAAAASATARGGFIVASQHPQQPSSTSSYGRNGFSSASPPNPSSVPTPSISMPSNAPDAPMSPYRIARFYKEMARRDTELSEKERLLRAMGALEARERQLSGEIAAMEAGNGFGGASAHGPSASSHQHHHNGLHQQQQRYADPSVSLVPSHTRGGANGSTVGSGLHAYAGEGANPNHHAYAHNPNATVGAVSIIREGSADGAAASSFAAAHRYQREASHPQEASLYTHHSHHHRSVAADARPQPSAEPHLQNRPSFAGTQHVSSHAHATAYPHGASFQRRDPQLAAREQQRRIAVEYFAQQQQMQQHAALANRGGRPLGGGGGFAAPQQQYRDGPMPMYGR